ncbi:aldo/keto reductase [Caryophanon latum]|uniref:Glyoxal reductase n=1 Tax=Caryophanon latum TaxID=33977 RepID=A0A1C0YFS1_9BACL|nr:aldo/keto reductase [Caryophanon latum]OCS86028.1 glyoxal reductase [Caryophanon latum]
MKKILRNGVHMPQLGLGVYKMTNRDETLQAIETALNVGYRAIDTAALYYNEEEVGEAVRNASVRRDELFITTKVWNDDQGYDETLRAFEVSLKKLDMEYVDLYLTHWPVEGKFTETYRAIERLYDEKLIRATGVSNHHVPHLQQLLAKANVPPMVNQIELHPYLTQQPLRAFCEEEGIAVTSWSPLGRANVLGDETLQQLGEQYGKSAAQIIIRWHLQHGLVVIPKSVTPSRIAENFDVFNFELSDAHMAQIDALNRNERFGQNPDHFNFDHLK